MAKKQEAKRSEYWQQMVGEHERSGLPVRTFCEQAGLNEHSSQEEIA
jgi:enamine deaminase RidA (YjgF/YER057c/UK114 family)